jgi:hypothetical protein
MFIVGKKIVLKVFYEYVDKIIHRFFAKLLTE